MSAQHRVHHQRREPDYDLRLVLLVLAFLAVCGAIGWCAS